MGEKHANFFFSYDDRLAKLAITIKDWAKRVKVVAMNRFNSYTITLLIVHFLQCGVSPPVLPNLIALQPNEYDGSSKNFFVLVLFFIEFLYLQSLLGIVRLKLI